MHKSPDFNQLIIDYVLSEEIDERMQEELASLNISKISNKEFLVELPNISFTQFKSQDQLSQQNIWQQDDALPSFVAPKYENPVNFIWKGDYLFWFNESNEIIGYNLADKTFYFSTQGGLFFYQYRLNLSEEGNYKIFNVIDNIPAELAVHSSQKALYNTLMDLKHII